MLIAYLSVDIYYIEEDVAGNTKSASSVHNFKPKFEIIYVKYVDFSTLRKRFQKSTEVSNNSGSRENMHI